MTHGTKRVENRTWYARHRGLLLIHAGKRYQTGMETYIHNDSPEVDISGMLNAPRGAIVGICRLIDCIRPGEDEKLPEDQRIWSDPNQFKFLVTDVEAFEVAIPWKGALGFFDILDDAIDSAARRSMSAAPTHVVTPASSLTSIDARRCGNARDPRVEQEAYQRAMRGEA